MALLSFLRGSSSGKTSHTSAVDGAVEEFFKAQAASKSHLNSPSISDSTTRNEELRRQFKPVLPAVFTSLENGSSNIKLVPCTESELINKQDKENNSAHVLSEKDRDILASLFPNTINNPFYLITASGSSQQQQKTPLRIGVVLSGGQAAGGHNVICGVFDYAKRVSSESVIFGFLGGPHGVYSENYQELSAEVVNKYRNMGGFDMIRSGRHKIETDEQKQQSLEVCKKLKLDGLVVIGGDDSNTNAAVLAEYFKAKGSSTCVIGCPKTIDGDLKNLFVEISFGFDTACKTYCQAIGNMMEDAKTSRNTYHFVRLMGRSASLITLECALQTHPNLAFIGEEVQARKQSLHHLVCTVADLVQARHAKGKNYGVILLPEGLIEFIPEVGVLINEINLIVAKGEFSLEQLSAESRRVFEELPETTRQQLLLDRDPHGNVQVAMIHTEKLLMEMTETELRKRQLLGGSSSSVVFHAQAHYLGYEGRSGYPSNFDATYCYALGNVAAALIENKATACLAVLKNMSTASTPAEWRAAGVPLTSMMTLESRKGKANVPVIKKFLVDIEKPLFKAFAQVRDEWRCSDYYVSPGPLQLHQPNSAHNQGSFTHNNNTHRAATSVTTAAESTLLSLPFTLQGPPPTAALLSSAAATTNSLCCWRQSVEPLVPALLKHKDVSLALLNPTTTTQQQPTEALVLPPSHHHPPGFMSAACSEKMQAIFPLLLAEKNELQQLQQQHQQRAVGGGALVQGLQGSCTGWVLQKGAEKLREKPKVGVVLIGRESPGYTNVLVGIVERTLMMVGSGGGPTGGGGGAAAGCGFGQVFCFKGAKGLLEKDFLTLSEKDSHAQRNQPAFSLLGRTPADELLLNSEAGLHAAAQTVRELNLEVLVVIGWTFLHAAVFAELLKSQKISTRIVNIEGQADFSQFPPEGALSLLHKLSPKKHVITAGDKENAVVCPMLAKWILEQMSCRGLGFDTQTKVASEMIANLQTDSSSAAKYYYFCQVAGGLDAECEVAVQTHPNLVISSSKWKDAHIKEIVQFLVEAVKKRAALKKNFGVVLLHENFFMMNKKLRALAAEVEEVLVTKQQQLGKTMEKVLEKLSKQSKELLCALPENFQSLLISTVENHRFPRGVLRFPVHELLSQMVSKALKKEQSDGTFSGTFSPVCFHFSNSISASYPSYYDCSLGLTLGHLAVLAGTSQSTKLSALHVSVANPTENPLHWQPAIRSLAVLAIQAHCLHAGAAPATAAAHHSSSAASAAEKICSQLCCLLDGNCLCSAAIESPIVALAAAGMQEQQLHGGGDWLEKEKYCNPGPLQFGEPAQNYYYTRALWEVACTERNTRAENACTAPCTQKL